MRKLSKNYSPLGGHQIIVADIPGFDVQDIRLVVNETQGEVLVSSLNKAGVSVASDVELPDGRIAKKVITIPNSLPAIGNSDVLTIEVERDDVAKEETLRDFAQMLIAHMHTGIARDYSCAKADSTWYFFTGRRSAKGNYIWRSFDVDADHPFMYAAFPDLDMDEGGDHLYADDDLTDEYRVEDARNDLFATKQDVNLLRQAFPTIPSDLARKGDIPTDYAKPGDIPAIPTDYAKKSDIPTDYATSTGMENILRAITSLQEGDIDLLKKAMATVLGSLGEKAQFTLFEIVAKILTKVETELAKSEELTSLNEDRTEKHAELLRLLTTINNTVGGYTTERIEQASEDILEQTEQLNANIQAFTGSVDRIAANNTQLAESNRDLAGAVNNFANSLSSLQESYQPETPTAATSAEIHAIALRVTGYLDLIVS